MLASLFTLSCHHPVALSSEYIRNLLSSLALWLLSWPRAPSVPDLVVATASWQVSMSVLSYVQPPVQSSQGRSSCLSFLLYSLLRAGVHVCPSFSISSSRQLPRALLRANGFLPLDHSSVACSRFPLSLTFCALDTLPPTLSSSFPQWLFPHLVLLLS